MRIIHADSDDIENPLRGGQPVRTYEINTRLSKNHHITVLTATYKGCETQVERKQLHYQRLGVTIPRWGLSSHLSYLARLPTAVKNTPHDLVVEEFAPPFGFCDLHKVTSKPVISIVQWFFFNDWQKRYKLPFEAMMRKRAVAQPQRQLIVQTNKMGDYFQDLLPQATIYKVPCGINVTALQASEVLGEYALYLGRLDTQHKGLDDLLLAWKMLTQQGLAIPLWIVGTGQDERALKNQVNAFGLNHLVHFKGRFEHAEKNHALRHCRFLVMPSRQETFGITALEAMASQKPVIAYDIDHLNELLKPSWSSLAKLGDVAGLAKLVAQYWQDQALCLAQGANAYQEAKHYLWDVLAVRQEEIYNELVKRRK
jgi:glycosyltransferase involved in cell wall biosynthesis